MQQGRRANRVNAAAVDNCLSKGMGFAVVIPKQHMKSAANIKGHPIHPIIIAFPIAFFMGCFLFDLLGIALDNQDLWQVGYYLEIAGVVFALLAAIPGIIDYLRVVPPASSAKKRAAKHGILNTTVLLLFLAVFIYRHGSGANAYVVLVLELVGVVLLSISGWLGGTLVYRNQIGVDIRYAGAGKWKEQHIHEPGSRVKAASTVELQPGQMKLLVVNGKRIVVARTEDGYNAFDDHCTHKGGSLAGGALACDIVQCPWHGSQFNVKTGAVKAGPAKEPVTVYPVVELDGSVYVLLEKGVVS